MFLLLILNFSRLIHYLLLFFGIPHYLQFLFLCPLLFKFLYSWIYLFCHVGLLVPKLFFQIFLFIIIVLFILLFFLLLVLYLSNLFIWIFAFYLFRTLLLFQKPLIKRSNFFKLETYIMNLILINATNLLHINMQLSLYAFIIVILYCIF